MRAPAPLAGSTAWLLQHDLRLAWRDFRSTFGSLGSRALTGLLVVLVGLMHLLVYPMAADFGALANTPARLDEVYGVALPMAGFALLLMTAQTLNGTTKLLYARGDLDLLLSSPVPASRILISRALSVASGAFTSAAIFVLPIADAGAAAGHPRLLALYPTLVGGALLAAAVGLTMGLALFRSIGPRRTRLAAQLLATLIGAVFMIGLQVHRAFPGFMASGIVPRHGWMHDAALLPVRAALAEPMPLLVWFAVGLATFAAAALLLGPAFAASVKAAVGAGATGPGSASRTGSRGTPRWRPGHVAARHAGWSFRRSAGASLRSKEWRLIGRDPWVASQILLQILYMTPMIAILWSGSGDPALAIAPTVVVVTFQVASSLTWLSLSGEDAPDLLQTAPITAGVVRRAKIEAVGCLTLGIVALPLLYLATVSLAAAALAVGLGAIGLCTAVMLQLWHGSPARRSAFAARHRESKLMALIEMSFSLLFGLTTALSVLGSAWGLAPFAVVGAILLWLRPRGFPTEAGAAR